jgi:hypothetical protein
MQRKARPQVGRPTHVRKLGAPTQREARLQVGRKRMRPATQTQGTFARPQVGRPNATQGTSARWSPKRKTHPQQKRPHKGALG